jgi:uncharacterized coiled-coil protein SlyX
LRATHRQSPREESVKPERLERENERLIREVEKLREELIERDKRIADAEKQIADAEKQIADAEKQIADAEKQIADAEKQIADLERKLALRQQNSTTSSKPPSSDGMAGEQRLRGSRRKKSRRKPGGQPGHDGRWRGLTPLSRVDEFKKVFPSRCRHCDHRLSSGMPAEGDPRRHQVTELPPIEAHITEYQCHRVVCPECGKATQAELPPQRSVISERS